MADGGDKTGDSQARELALLLSGLVLAEDEHIAAFRERHELIVSVEKLTELRSLLRELGALMKQAGDPRWDSLPAALIATEDTPDEERAEEPPEDELPEGAVRPPGSVGEMLSGPAPAEPIGEVAPSPWTAISSAAEQPTPSSPAIPPPPGPIPPPPERERLKTEPPDVSTDGALPFSEPPPNPETPDAKSLPPPALASVIAGLPPMTVVSYAAFCASCEAMPQRIAETHAKFGVIGTTARASLDEAWRRKLDEDERLHALWSALTQQFRSWLTLHR